MGVKVRACRQNGKPHQAGLTLLEAIAFLGISGLVVGGALAMYSSASTSQATGQVVNEFQSLRAGTKSLYAPPSGYGTAFLNIVLDNAKKVPGTLTASGFSIMNDWGGYVFVLGETSRFFVSFSEVPKAVCVGMLPALTASNSWLGYNVVSSGSWTGAMTAIAGQISPDTASTACANNKNRVTLWSA